MPLYLQEERAESLEEVKAQQARALAAAERAVALAPRLPDGLAVRGVLREVIDLDWVGAKDDFARALAANPNHAPSHASYAGLLASEGRMKPAIDEARRSVSLDPLGGSWSKLGLVYQCAGDLELAEAAIRRDLQRSPDDLVALFYLGRNKLLQHQAREALQSFERCPQEEYRLWGEAVARHSMKDDTGSRAALGKLTTAHAHVCAYDIGAAHAWRGETEEAFQWLERALLQRDGALAAMLKSDPFLRKIRGDPRYPALLRKLKLPVD
jgi:tetratricopeptide (TPR) repeat protein